MNLSGGHLNLAANSAGGSQAVVGLDKVAHALWQAAARAEFLLPSSSSHPVRMVKNMGSDPSN